MKTIPLFVFLFATLASSQAHAYCQYYFSFPGRYTAYVTTNFGGGSGMTCSFQRGKSNASTWVYDCGSAELSVGLAQNDSSGRTFKDSRLSAKAGGESVSCTLVPLRL